MTYQPLLLQHNSTDLYKAIKDNISSEYEGFENSYIQREREFLVLEQFKRDYRALGDYDTLFRYYGDDGIREDMAWAVFDGVVELRDCGYKEALFILSLLNQFLGHYDGKYPVFRHIGDYELLDRYMRNRIMSDKIFR